MLRFLYWTETAFGAQPWGTIKNYSTVVPHFPTEQNLSAFILHGTQQINNEQYISLLYKTARFIVFRATFSDIST